MHAKATRLLSTLLVLLGLAMIISTLARGGGPAALGILLGGLFLAAGLGRMYVQRRIE
jgi:hypothetical protein